MRASSASASFSGSTALWRPQGSRSRSRPARAHERLAAGHVRAGQDRAADRWCLGRVGDHRRPVRPSSWVGPSPSPSRTPRFVTPWLYGPTKLSRERRRRHAARGVEPRARLAARASRLQPLGGLPKPQGRRTTRSRPDVPINQLTEDLGSGAALTSTLHWFETEMLTKEENLV
jgi:hypothetical protein